MSGVMAQALGLKQRDVHEAVLERERLGSTGVGEGVAIPHARIETLSRPVGGFARLQEAADFEAIDERPADLVFMLLAPTDAGADHLRALARAARVFRQERIRAALRQAQTRASEQRASVVQVQQQIGVLAAEQRSLDEQSRQLDTRYERLRADRNALAAPDEARLNNLRSQLEAAQEQAETTEARLAELNKLVASAK